MADGHLELDRSLADKKPEVLAYFRSRASEAVSEGRALFGETNIKKRASALNRALVEERERLVAQVRQLSSREAWTNEEVLHVLLMITYCGNVVMIETRNDIWPYDYMSLSRRAGELWEPFCALCFEHPVRSDVELFVPPLFSDVRDRLASEIADFIASLPIEAADKARLLAYYQSVWSLVSSGEIQLACDLHFLRGGERYVVDFKSGFGSNEKGNTNRLLLVASVYRNIERDDYHMMILVRAQEDDNNHYLQTLKQSGLWEVYCGADAYVKIHGLSGFDLGSWMTKNAAWATDLSANASHHFAKNNLAKYLTW